MTTKRTAKPGQQTGSLKALLLTGSVLATLAGARLLNLADIATAETAVSPPITISVPAQATTITIPAEAGITVPLPPNERGVQIELAPIPQVVQPQIQPVTRTRSSR